jgi:DNA-binding NtrC family response regulator
MGIKILLVDDEAPFVETLEKRLAKRGLHILPASGGLEALAKLDSEKDIDVVILDVMMPVMDGIETLLKIKQTHPLVEVIMLTGHATVTSAIDGMKHGALDYLMKPCDMEVLLAKVREAKEKKTRQEERIAEAHAINAALRRGSDLE